MMSGSGGSSLPLAMLSLVGGMFLLVKSCSAEMCCRLFAKIVAWVVIIISIILVISSGYWRVTKCMKYGWCPGKGMGMMYQKGMMKGMMPPPPMPGEQDMGED